jgi:isochorismate pyruvate lyase
MTDLLSPEQCRTMTEVRAGVDQIDRELVALLARRFGFMNAAARIKPDRGAVRDEGRKQQVIDNVRREARAAGIPEAVIAAVWETLIEGSIAYELERFDSLREDAAR